MSTLNRVGCIAVDCIVALVLALMAFGLALGGFIGTFAAAVYFPPDSMSQVGGCLIGLAVMWSGILPMLQIEKLDFGQVSC